MKTARIMTVALVVGFGLFGSPALADMTAQLSTGHGANFGAPVNGGGGYFTVTPGGTGWSAYGITSPFKTFCVEAKYFTPGATYNATIDTQVLQLGPQAIQTATANLYANYLADIGTIGMTAIGEDGSKNRAMQALFWDYQKAFGSTGLYGVGYNLLIYPGEQILYTSFHNANIANANAGNVRALNLWSGTPYTGTDVQSQLVMIPVPGAILLGLFGFGLIGWIKRRFA